MPYPTGFISRGRGMNGSIRSSSLPLPAHRPPAEEPQQSAQEPSAKRRCWRVPQDARLNTQAARRTALFLTGGQRHRVSTKAT